MDFNDVLTLGVLAVGIVLVILLFADSLAPL